MTDFIRVALLKARGLLVHSGFHAWMALLAAVASAIATYFGYLAAEKSAEVAGRAQEFSERMNREQIALASPVLSVMSGSLVRIEARGSNQKPSYRLELVIHNAGARSALPAWVGLFERDTAFGDTRERQKTVWQISSPQIAEIPSSADRKVTFELDHSFSRPTDWILALAYGDVLPNRAPVGQPASELSMVTRCSDVKILWLHAPKAEGAASVAESDVTLATPMLVDGRGMGATGMNEFDAAARQMQEAISKDGRCKGG